MLTERHDGDTPAPVGVGIKLGLTPGPEGRLSAGVAPPPARTHFYVIDALISGEWSTAGNALSHLILPAIVLAAVPASFLLRLLRANLMETSREQYMLVLRAKGTPRAKAFLSHAFPNAALPTITAGGLILAELLAGSVLTEKAFGWPGVGSLVVDSILAKDFSVVQSFIFLSALAYVVVMPGIRYQVHRWETTEQAVFTQSGWITRERRVAPLARVQTVDFEQGIVSRLLGLATVTVTTASAAGPVRIEGLDRIVAGRLVADLSASAAAETGDAT